MGADLKAERVVEDRNRFTAGGVSAGIDFGLTLAARLANEDDAKRIQLFEYDPKPPFDAGSPEGAGPALSRPKSRATSIPNENKIRTAGSTTV
jgi:cyclohexyl-isocyanide hydratase